MDLNRSVRLLEEALSPHGKSLLRTVTPKKYKDSARRSANEKLDISLKFVQEETQREKLLEGGITFSDKSLYNVLQQSNITGSVIVSNRPWETALESLFTEYLEIIQSHKNVQEVFETISDLARCCSDMLNVVRGLKSKVNTKGKDDEIWLENERNTWRLIYCLYQERLTEQDSEDYIPYSGVSEKLCVELLYKRDALIRESQLIIDWLECNATDAQIDAPEVQHFTDKSVGWENTLHQLQASESIVFKSSRNIVSSLDPDAPIRENLPLHDLDVEDEARLTKKIFIEIRCGKLDEAQNLCLHCGHAWKAAMLDGWRLYHDPNLNYTTDELAAETNEDDGVLTVEKIQKQRDAKNVNTGEIKMVEGNVNRDLWKMMAWKYCQEKCIGIYERATVGTFCGCLQAMLLACQSWEDMLWAYMKTMVDIRVESEIRDFVSRDYRPLPQEYWNNKMSLDEIFEKLSSVRETEIRAEASSPIHLIQKYIILDQIPQLMASMEEWIEDGTASPQFLRFLAHIVLILKQIGQSRRDDISERVLEAYVKCLMTMNSPELVAYYVSKLGQQQQIKLYAAFLENIHDYEGRKLALKYAEDAGLNVRSIAKQVVENIKNQPEDFESFTNLQRVTSDKDKIKISALEWLLFYPSQRVEALYQSNSLISYFLTLGKVDAAKAAFSKIPMAVLDSIVSLPEEQISELISRYIQEHLCYKAYLDAHEAFNDWFKYFHHSRPAAPAALPENMSFTEKVAYEHKLAQYKAETERWKMTVGHLAKTAKSSLYNVLLFPKGGWLNAPENPTHLRENCIPEVALLLYSVLKESGDYTECIQLADILASEKYQLYKVYTKTKLEDILKKLFESSVALLDENKDMWGDLFVDVISTTFL